jgi:glycosyltransferase involved in cell wall biosynthesis
VAKYYQAADLYIHAARAEVFGKTIAEALACGTPVVATAVGGIPEVLKGLAQEGNIPAQLNQNPSSGATGILTPAGDARAMAQGMETLLADDDLRRRLSENAAKDSRERFSLERQTMSFLDWYEEVIRDWKADTSHHPGD